VEGRGVERQPHPNASPAARQPRTDSPHPRRSELARDQRPPAPPTHLPPPRIVRAGEGVKRQPWLLAYLLAGGACLCAVLGIMTYAILARIDQGFAVFG